MSQFDAPYTDYVERPRESSGMATAALVLGVLGIIPVCGLLFGLLALLVGVIAIATLGERRGKGLAIIGIVLGLLFTAVWGGAMFWIAQFSAEYATFMREAPDRAFQAGYGGDYAGFRAEFDGPAATASDAEVQAFLDELTERYGTFVEVRMDRTGQQQPQFGQAVVDMPYQFVFSESTVDGEIELILANEQATSVADAFMKKLGGVTIFDRDRGDLTYPPPTSGRAARPGDGDAAADDGADADEDVDVDVDEGEDMDAPPGT